MMTCQMALLVLTMLVSSRHAEASIDGSWMDGPYLSIARRDFGFAYFDGYLVAAGGANSEQPYALSSVESLQVRWLSAWNLPCDHKQQLQTPRSDFGFASLAGKVYASGGGDQNANLLTGTEAADNNGWEDLSSCDNGWAADIALPGPRSSFALAAFGNSLYAVGGVSAAFKPFRPYPISSVDVLIEGSWSSGPALSAPRVGHGLAALGGYLYVVGGVIEGNYTSSVEVLAFGAKNWTKGPALLTPRTGLGLASCGGRLYAVGGTTLNTDGQAGHLASVEVLDPAVGKWVAGPSLSVPRYGHGVAAVNDLSDKYCLLFAAGGVGCSPTTNTCNTLISMEYLNVTVKGRQEEPLPRHTAPAQVVV